LLALIVAFTQEAYPKDVYGESQLGDYCSLLLHNPMISLRVISSIVVSIDIDLDWGNGNILGMNKPARVKK